MAHKTLSTDTRHDGAADTFLARQGEILRHWAAPKVEAARAWGEAGAAYGKVGGSVAAEQYGPQVKDRLQDAGQAVAERYGKVAPAVATGVTALAPLLSSRGGAAAEVVERLRDQLEQAGEQGRKKSAAARKDAKKKAKKGKKAGAATLLGLQKDGRKASKKASRKAGKAQRRLADRADRAKDAAGKGGLTAAGLVAAALAAVQDKSQELGPQVQDRLAQASAYAQQRRDQYAPVAAARLADAAGRAGRTAHDVQVPASVEQALIALTGDRKIVDRLRSSAEDYAAQAEKGLNRRAGRPARATRARSGGRGWILAGMAAAAAGASFAVWKLTKPVQDPWTAPVPGPITANIPVVESSANPYAQQERVVAEARLNASHGEQRTEVVDVRPTVQNEDPQVADPRR